MFLEWVEWRQQSRQVFTVAWSRAANWIYKQSICGSSSDNNRNTTATASVKYRSNRGKKGGRAGAYEVAPSMLIASRQ